MLRFLRVIAAVICVWFITLSAQAAPVVYSVNFGDSLPGDVYITGTITIDPAAAYTSHIVQSVPTSLNVYEFPISYNLTFGGPTLSGIGTPGLAIYDQNSVGPASYFDFSLFSGNPNISIEISVPVGFTDASVIGVGGPITSLVLYDAESTLNLSGTMTVESIPEPASFMLFGTALALVIGWSRSRRLG